MLELWRNFADNEDGATAIEYGLIAVLIALFLVAALTSIGTAMSGRFNQIASNLQR